MKKGLFINIILPALLISSAGCTSAGREHSAKKSNDNLINAVLYQQTAAEYRALCFQTFHLGKIMLMNDLNDESVVKPRVVIVDIDETILDNSPYEAKCVIDNISYPEMWKEWVDLGCAKAIPGAVDFLNYIDSLGVGIKYVTNRKQTGLAVTMQNLIDEGCPQVQESNMFMRENVSSKEYRREIIMNEYHVSLLAGDNLGDFTDLFEGKSIDERSVLVDSIKYEFGTRFLVLPNAMYGSWDSALFEGHDNLTKQQKEKMRIEHLESF